MKPASQRRTSCLLCDSRRLEPAFQLKPTPVADAYVPAEKRSESQPYFPLDLGLCMECGHLQLLDAVDPDILFGQYTFVTQSSLGLVEHFRGCVKAALERARPKPGSLVVDIGSNDGSLLKLFKEAGMTVLGVDPACEIARRAAAGGVETINAYFTRELGYKLRRERRPAAIVTANNVFAHSAALGDMADGVRELLAPDGIFVFEVSYLVDILDEMLFDTIYHEHLCYHSVKPLRLFFARHGLELIDVERIAAKGGSIRGVVQLAGGPKPASAKVAELLALEARMGLDTLETFKAFEDKIASAKAGFLEVVGSLKAKGKTVAGYGASVTVTTLLHHFELGDKLEFLIDDNPVKQGAYSPGQHLPVLKPEALRERKPDYVAILAWKYAQPIMRKNQAFLDQGGRFIIPLPRVSVVPGEVAGPAKPG